MIPSPSPQRAAAPDPPTIDAVNRIIADLEDYGVAKLHKLLTSFIAANSDPIHSPNYHSPAKDDLAPLASLLYNSLVLANRSLLLCVIRALKICVRKASNRMALPVTILSPILQLFGTVADEERELNADLGNFILNVCYYPPNISNLLSAVPHLVQRLGCEDEQVQIATAGALQSICMHDDGKGSLIESQGIPVTLHLLEASNATLVSRCAGILHNVSTAWPGVHQIRDRGGLPLVVGLLNEQFPAEVRRHAAAILQNCSRDKASAAIILEHDAISLLTRLLFCDDLTTQMPATGALLNLHGTCGDRSEQRQALKAALGQSIAVGMLSSALQDCLGVMDGAPPPERTASGTNGAAVT